MWGIFYKIEKLLPRSKLFLISSRKVCQIVKKVSEMKNVEKYNRVPTIPITKDPRGEKRLLGTSHDGLDMIIKKATKQSRLLFF